MSVTVNSIIQAASKEWDFWGRSTWNLVNNSRNIVKTDDDEKYSQYVINNYCSIGGGNPSLIEIQDDRYAWSAVGMSAIMKNAGFNKSEFPFAQSHSVYIRKFITERVNNNKNAAFWGYRHGENGGQPAVGDMIGYARGKGVTADMAKNYFDKKDPYESHTDVVVAVRPGEIDVIGANVLDSVTKKTLKISAEGHIQDISHYWFVILKRKMV